MPDHCVANESVPCSPFKAIESVLMVVDCLDMRSVSKPSYSFSVRQFVFTFLVVIEIVSLTGCAGLRTPWHHSRESFVGIPRPRFSDDPQIEEIVDHLNRNVEKTHAWRSNTVRIRANSMPLSGMLVVEEGQHLRLLVNSFAGNEVDMGSNDDVFWIWAKRMEPSYVFCKHEEIDAARQTLGIPFEPQWLMQALGVAPLDTKDLEMKIDRKNNRAILIQPVMTAHGHTLKKVMEVDLNHGVILDHSVFNPAGQRVAQARLEDFRLDKRTGVVMAHRVRLDWPQNDMSLVMNLDKVEINPRAIPKKIWQMPPPANGVQVVDLGAESRPGIRYAESEPASNRFSELETEPSEKAPGRVRVTAESPDQSHDSSPRKSRAELVDPVRFQNQSAQPERKSSWEE